MDISGKAARITPAVEYERLSGEATNTRSKKCLTLRGR
jgi:hypothetical protein